MSASDELVTLRDWLRWAVSRFNAEGLAFGHGSTNAWDEAVYLLLWTLHLPLDRLEPFLDARLTEDERLRVEEVLGRRIGQRVPAAYLTGEAWLGDFRFRVDERVLIPRSYIAELLGDGLAPWIADPSAVTSALDLCTGSGCLAILLAHHYPEAEIDAVDLSPDALAVASLNVADYGLQGRINLVRSDLFANLADKAYDLIVCNPPYVTEASMAELPPEHRHEPAFALAAGVDGMDAVRRLLADASHHLTAEGVLVVEVGHNREIVESVFPTLPFTWLSTASHEGAVFLLTREELVRATTDAAAEPARATAGAPGAPKTEPNSPEA